MQDVTIFSFLAVSQLSCYWCPAADGPAQAVPETAAALQGARGPNAILQPLDCSLSLKLLSGGSNSAPVLEAAAVVPAVDVQLHQHQVWALPTSSAAVFRNWTLPGLNQR